MQPTVEQALARMVAAWDAGDAGAFAQQFTEDATYVVYAGVVSRGREQIRRDHVPVLTRWQRGTRMRVEVSEVRYLGEDVAVVLSEGGIGKGRRVPTDKVQTFVLRRQADGHWLCEAFQNTRKNRLMSWMMTRSTR